MDYETAQVAKMTAGVRLAAALDGLITGYKASALLDADYVVDRVTALVARYDEETAEADAVFASLVAERIEF